MEACKEGSDEYKIKCKKEYREELKMSTLMKNTEYSENNFPTSLRKLGDTFINMSFTKKLCKAGPILEFNRSV